MLKTPQDLTHALSQVTERIWRDRDLSVIDSYYHADAQVEGLLPDTVLPMSEARMIVGELVQFVQLVDRELKAVIATEDGHFTARQRVEFLLKTSGARGWIESVIMWRIEDGLIRHEYQIMDVLNFFERAGALPQGALYLLFSGGQLR